MSEAQKIIGELYERGMSFTSIGACIGRSREAISRAYYGHNSGSRMLPRLRQLYHFVEDVGPGYDQGARVSQDTGARYSEPDVPPEREYSPPRRSTPAPDWVKVAGAFAYAKASQSPAPRPQPQPPAPAPYQPVIPPVPPAAQPSTRLGWARSARYVDGAKPGENEQRPNNPLRGR
jgi:hypothetical protein